MSKHYSAVPGPGGSKMFYDENGKLVGSSVPGFCGSEVFYDQNGKTVGYGTPGLFEGTSVYTDVNGKGMEESIR